MTTNSSDTHHAMFAAFGRSDRCLVASSDVKGAAFKRVAQKLMASGLVRELKARADMPVWRRDEEGRANALKLSAAGVRAVEVGAEEGLDATDKSTPVVVSVTAGPAQAASWQVSLVCCSGTRGRA